ncbi:hypothetical protein [Glaciibacter superstes]|uniref:hypothetical protein n=1 Tax=Glaciibacter superstes TaxID=501023 RepID=UPI0003B6360B|nr:hypothetical protein [Glaciibacter superstes]
MKLVSTPRIEFLRSLATEILHNYGRGRAIVSVDGPDSAGRAEFADDLAAVFDEREHPEFRASLRYFQRSRAEQAKFGPESEERLFRHGYDYSALRRVLVEPFRMGGSTGFVMKVFNPDSDTWIEPTWLTAPDAATLIVDGEFANRRELRGLWSYSILLAAEAESEADRLYLAEETPNALVSALIDNSDPDAPHRLFTDSC